MGLKEVLSKLKLVELAAAPPRATGSSAGGAAPGAGPELEQLLAALPEPPPIDDRALAPAEGSGGELEIPGFGEIYRSAGIGEPAHGFTALKVHEMLASPGLAELAPSAKAAALAGFLAMNPGGRVALGEIIQDAVRRDQALDRFEGFLAGKLAQRRAAVERDNALLQAELDELARKHRATMEANQRALAALAAKVDEWRAAKRAEERRLQAAVAPFVEGNPITVDPSAAGGEAG